MLGRFLSVGAKLLTVLPGIIGDITGAESKIAKVANLGDRIGAFCDLADALANDIISALK